MAFDYKKEYKEYYLPKDKPSIVTVPPMNFVAVRGKGDPNAESGEYKEKTDFSRVEFLTYDEGLCVQCMHIGPYDNEPATVELMHQFMSEQGYALDITDLRYHHEIYLSDARKTAPDKLKTVIRHPIKKV